MADNEDPEQLRLMKRMVELAEYQVKLAKQRTEMSADRSRMSADRSRMSEDRSRMSADRSKMSEHRSYQNAERTLSVWTRTALALMVFGIAVDRFTLLLRHPSWPEPAGQLPPHALSHIAGAVLVAFGALMALACGIRFMAYAVDWRRRHPPIPYHGPYLAFSFSMLTTLFGIGVLALMLIFT